MHIRIDIPTQWLRLEHNGAVLAQFPISSAARGLGEESGSYCTPRGAHIVRAKIGAGMPLNSVFVRRRPTGEIYTPELGAQSPDRDWILTRIFWLSGTQVGVNRLGRCDTMRRYIYIHGTPDEVFEQIPASHGCIRMRNEDVLQLFDMTPVYTPVQIEG